MKFNKELFAFLNNHGWEFSHTDQLERGSYTITRAWFRRGPHCVLMSQALHDVQQKILRDPAARVANRVE